MNNHILFSTLWGAALLGLTVSYDTYGCNPNADCIVNPDGLIPDPSSCHRYYSCSGTEPRGPYICPDDMWFNTVACVPGDCYTNTCDTTCNVRCTAIGDLVPHPVNCSEYYVCSPSGLTKLSCNPGTFFDGSGCTGYANRCCVYCWESCLDVEDYGYIIDPEDCTQYIRCIDGTRNHYSCPDGEYFNIGLEECEPGECQSYCGP